MLLIEENVTSPFCVHLNDVVTVQSHVAAAAVGGAKSTSAGRTVGDPTKQSCWWTISQTHELKKPPNVSSCMKKQYFYTVTLHVEIIHVILKLSVTSVCSSITCRSFCLNSSNLFSLPEASGFSSSDNEPFVGSNQQSVFVRTHL